MIRNKGRKWYIKWRVWRLERTKKKALEFIARAELLMAAQGFNRAKKRRFWREFIGKGKIDVS